MIHRELVETGLPASRLWTANQRDDLGAHDIASHIAMASRPAKARDIKQALMLAFWQRGIKICGMIARRSFQARTLSP
jgi:hypothetical protein